MTLTTEQTKKFWSQVSKGKGNSCWLWEGAQAGSYGYFQFYDESGELKRYTAHRMSFMLANSPLGPRDFIKHSCRNRLCVNPRHIYVRKNIEIKMPDKKNKLTFDERCRRYNEKFPFQMTERRDRALAEFGVRSA